MTHERYSQFDDALSELWVLPPLDPNLLSRRPAFKRFQAACEQLFPQIGKGQELGFALGTALQATGLPCRLSSSAQRFALPIDAARAQLIALMSASAIRRRYLCPLDLADDLPKISFGPARIVSPSVSELAQLFDAERLARFYPEHRLEIDRLSLIQWLVIEETVPVRQPPARRSLPFLFDIWKDVGEIYPHQSPYEGVVERALFILLLAPWEEWTRYDELDWRGFNVPWVYTLDEDLFVRPAPPPSPDTLSWEPDFIDTHEGETIEIERPALNPLSDAAQLWLRSIDDEAWTTTARALESSLFETPVVHFIVRAFLARKVDEVLAHLTAIEAALGTRRDFQHKDPGPSGKPAKNATTRLSLRIEHLLNDPEAGKEFENLSNVRSSFLHGRNMETISSAKRNMARALARRVAHTLYERAVAPESREREAFLNSLL